MAENRRDFVRVIEHMLDSSRHTTSTRTLYSDENATTLFASFPSLSYTNSNGERVTLGNIISAVATIFKEKNITDWPEDEK